MQPLTQPLTPLARPNRHDTRLEILRQRAAILSREIHDDRQKTVGRQFIEFQLAGEHYGVESLFVREVHPLRELTPLPGTPPFLRGIVNIRSSIMPVIDIKKFFGLPDIGISDLNKIIIVHSLETRRPMQLGVLADAILGMRNIVEKDIQTTLSYLEGNRANYFHGIFQGEKNERLILLDMASILKDEHILVNDV